MESNQPARRAVKSGRLVSPPGRSADARERKGGSQRARQPVCGRQGRAAAAAAAASRQQKAAPKSPFPLGRIPRIMTTATATRGCCCCFCRGTSASASASAHADGGRAGRPTTATTTDPATLPHSLAPACFSDLCTPTARHLSLSLSPLPPPASHLSCCPPPARQASSRSRSSGDFDGTAEWARGSQPCRMGVREEL